ncbi:MAG: DUF924 domain-containing protein [Proteobacteria bacterium]|nr:DUF924 domain-containing protein [Pseudomonadota bacterium]
MDQTTRQVLDYWFGPAGSADAQGPRGFWFKSTPAQDAEIRRLFLAEHERAAAGGIDAAATADDYLCRLILLDQFPRNMFRGQARAFATDVLALESARAGIGRGFDRIESPHRRLFYYLPFEHSENLADQDECMRLLEAMNFGDYLVWAEKHRGVIREFGRFPHRNAALGRTNKPAETEYLARPGAGF